MPNKYSQKKKWSLKKQHYKVINWSEYNESLRRRGAIDVWLSEDAIMNWVEEDQRPDGTGTPQHYTNFAIITCHELRQVYRLPLRQTQGFIDSLFRRMKIKLRCPDFSTLSKRLGALNIKVPRYRKTDRPDDHVHAVAIDSTGLKRFGRGEWHQEKYSLSAKASWRKLHIAVNEDHCLEACVLTDRFGNDDQQVGALLDQIDQPMKQFTADGAYDETPIYEAILAHSPGADIVIPPRATAIVHDDAAPMRNRNLNEIKTHGRMAWQKKHRYGQRNFSELAVQRYQRILGDSMHSREIKRQQQEAMIGCGIINKMTSLGMPRSYRFA